MSQALNPNTVRRLAFIRFLYGQGLEQAARPQPLAAAALLSFHDAVEMFLLLAAEYLGVGLDRHTTFDGYWTQIDAQAGIQLSSRNAMRRMNNDRVNFKHHGSIPSATDLDQFRGDVTTFFTDATRAVFDVDFTTIDMIDLVTQREALTRLRNAETQANEGEYVEALALLSEAFEDLLSDYASRKRTTDASTPYTFGPENGFDRFTADYLSRDGAGYGMHLKGVGRHLQEVTDSLEAMQRAIRVLAVGLDYRRYARFEMLVPDIVRRFGDGHREVRPSPGLEVGHQDYQFCRQFVIETALHLAELDFDLDLHGLWQDHDKRQRQALDAQLRRHMRPDQGATVAATANDESATRVAHTGKAQPPLRQGETSP